MIELAHDPLTFVRKSAIYYLQFVPPSLEVANLTWNLVASGEVASTRGHEALRTYVAHAPAGESDSRLVDLALGDRRESVRYEATCLIDVADIDAVWSFLEGPPLITWSVHSLLLDVCVSNGIKPPPIGHLREVDNLEIADDLAHLPI